MPLARIISGGQTGVDRGALDASLDAGFPCGGWCPPGRTAEDGPIPPRYPLTEMAAGGYRERTLQNVRDSDGTLVIFFGRLHGGTAQTVQDCIRERKPYELVDAERVEATVASRVAARFVTENRVAVLNVAGPRASGNAAAYGFARDTIARLLQMSGMREQGEADMSETAYYVVESAKSFDQAATDLDAAVRRNGFGVLHVHDLGGTLRGKGVAFAEQCKVFEVCNPAQAARVLSADMRLNMALPCRISVFTEKGATKIGLIRPARMLASLSRDEGLLTVAEDVERTTIRMVDEAK